MTGGLWQFPKAAPGAGAGYVLPIWCGDRPPRRLGKGVQDNRAMPIVISHAAAPGPRCRTASAALQLPHLQALLHRAGAQTLYTGTPDSLTTLTEHLAADQTYPDGLVPWAAWLAQDCGLYESGQDWALISPCHLQIHSDHVAMQDPGLLQLKEDESRTLLAAMQPYFKEDGIALHWHSAHTWLAQGPVFQDLTSASLERVRGEPIDPWIPRQPAAQGLRRLQNEMQMLLYTHALNDARSARGQAPVNGFWISGTGSPMAAGAQAPLSVDPLHTLLAQSRARWGPISPHAIYIDTLTVSALNDDPQAWTQAWQTLDAQVFAPLVVRQPGFEVSISLCGEHRARTWVSGRASLWQRIKQQLTAPGFHHFVQDL